MILAAIVEKFSFGIAVIVLYLGGRMTGQLVIAGIIDLILGSLFVISYFRVAFAEPLAASDG
jgi:hypothetical protein